MQSASAELTAAITASERTPICRISVDWDNDGSFTTVGSGYQDDISADVVSVSVRRELTTDLPAEAKLFAGAAAATATITLAHRDPAGDPTKHAAWFYSPLNSASPLYAKKRKGRPAKVELGFVGASGPEYVTQLVGTVRSLQVAAGGRTATLEIVDRSESLRKQVTLPAVVADGQNSAGETVAPGLNTTFLADWVARKCGYAASPPIRSGCRFSATMHGSGFPEVGTIQHHHGENASMLAYSPRPGFPTAARWVQALNTNGSSGQEVTYVLGSGTTISTNNGSTCLFEGWFKFNTTSADQPLFIAYTTGASVPFISLYWQSSSGELELLCNRGGADNTNRAAVGPTISPGTSSWHYYAVQVTFSSTQIAATFRYDSTTTGPVTVATSSVTGETAINTIGIARGKVSSFASGWLDGLTEAVQFTSESSTSTWNNAFTPTAQIMASDGVDNQLVAAPAATEQGWALLQQIAAGEFATTGFTETGEFTFWPRTRWTTAPYTTSQRTLTAAAALTDLAAAEAVDQVRNRIVAPVTTPTVGDSQTVWKLSQRVSIPAAGSKTLWANLPVPAANVDTNFTYSVTPGDGSRYAAGTQPGGIGSQVSNLSFTVTVLSPTSVKIVVSNPNPFTVWLTGDENFTTAFKGKPYVWLDAQPIDFGASVGGDQRAEASDATSIAAYGEQLLELPASDFRQTLESVQSVVDDLRDDLADPGPILTDTPIVADPRLQLGDRVTVSDPDGLAATGDFHIAAIETTLDGGGMRQVLSSRALVAATAPVGAASRANIFEGGSDGATITTGNSGGTSGDAFDTVLSSGSGSAAPVYRAASPIRNLRSARAVAGISGVSATAWTWPAGQLDAYSRCYYRAPSPLPSGNVYLLQSCGASNGNAAQIRLTSSGTFQVTNASDASQGTSATTVAANDLFRLELHHRCEPGGGNGAIEARIFTGADLDNAADDPTETLGPYTTGASTVIGEQRAGATFSAVAVTVDYDNFAASSVTWVGPTPAPPASVDYARIVGFFTDTDEHYNLTDPALTPAGKISKISIHWNVAGITGRIAAIRASHPTIKLYAYQNVGGMIAGPHTNNRPTTLVTQEQATAHGTGGDDWRLHKESDGTVIVFNDFTYLQAAHVGRTSWRTQATQHFAGIAADGFDGIFLDDLNMIPGHGFNEGDANDSTEFASNNAYRDAMVATCAVLKAAADAVGLELVANVGLNPWDADPYAGYTSMLTAGSLHGVCREFWTNWAGETVYFDGATWTDTMKILTDAEANGAWAMVNTYPLTSPNHAESIRYGLASYYLFHWADTAAPEPDSGFGYNDGAPVSSLSEYRTTIGTPVEAKQLISGTSTDGAWMRKFSGGIVCVNAKSAVGNVTFNLGSSYLDPSGTPVTSVVLAKTRGMVLLTP